MAAQFVPILPRLECPSADDTFLRGESLPLAPRSRPHVFRNVAPLAQYLHIGEVVVVGIPILVMSLKDRCPTTVIAFVVLEDRDCPLRSPVSRVS